MSALSQQCREGRQLRSVRDQLALPFYLVAGAYSAQLYRSTASPANCSGASTSSLALTPPLQLTGLSRTATLILSSQPHGRRRCIHKQLFRRNFSSRTPRCAPMGPLGRLNFGRNYGQVRAGSAMFCRILPDPAQGLWSPNLTNPRRTCPPDTPLWISPRGSHSTHHCPKRRG